jgi:hypothetical protein
MSYFSFFFSFKIQFVDQNQIARNKRIKKTVRKVKDKDEIRLERTLRGKVSVPGENHQPTASH